MILVYYFQLILLHKNYGNDVLSVITMKLLYKNGKDQTK